MQNQLNQKNIVVTKNNKTILKGVRDKASTLWMIPITHHKIKALLVQDLPPVATVHTANSAHYQPTIEKLTAFYNATLGSLQVKTLCAEIRNN